ncbi:hypothetical protein HYV22_02825 [Candidatus Gottesmanbacteria bacterium]|nr:hypothetical protein [Candidatus Gottesmanbacteria bacterium]
MQQATEAGDKRLAYYWEFVHNRGVDNVCRTCQGLGTKGYGDTSTWRHTIGGQAMTTDVCDKCWGSGDEHRKGVDLRALRNSTHLFKSGIFKLYSGTQSTWMIDCKALTDADLVTIAGVMALRLGPFRTVIGIATGGLAFARHMDEHKSNSGPILIVDDVLTTGGSMENERMHQESIHGPDSCVGCVIFARGPLPSWVCAFQISGDLV